MNHENVLPKAVRDQVAAADEILKNLYPNEEGEEGDPAPETPESKDKAAAPPAEKPPAEKPAAPEGDEWEHKFKVLQGKYDKEVPRLHKQLRDSSNTASQLQDRLTKLEASIQLMKKAEEKPAPAAPAITQDEIDQFGPDLIDIVRRITRQETGVVLDEKLKPVEQGMKQVNEKVAKADKSMTQSAQERMLKDLADAVPNWAKQNEDPEFLEWLDQEDPYSGKARTELLANAWQSNNSPRLIALFQGFQKENAVVTPPSDEPSAETPAPEKKGKKEQPLDELVAPGTPKTGSTGAQNESGKKIWTQPEIKSFYAYKNEYIKKHPERDLPDDVVKLERDLFKAQAEGRIKG